MDLIRLEKLKRYYGTNLALDAGDVTLPSGAIGLLGPNGAGKSTLLKVLLGLLEPSEGGASVLGLDVRTQSLEIRGRVGYLSETESFVPGLKAVEFVALAGEVAGMPGKDAHRRAHEVLAYLGVEESRYRPVEDLPTGIKQRIQLAQAIVHDPELLILDEPTNGLDPGGRRAMLGLIASLNRDFKKSVILSSHLLDDVASVCESVVIIDRGRVLAHGRIDVLRASLRGRYRLTLGGDAGPFMDRLRARDVSVLEAAGPDAGETRILVEVPRDFPPRRFFDLVVESSPPDAAGNGGGDGAGSPVLRGLVPDEETLTDIFERVVRGGKEEPARA